MENMLKYDVSETSEYLDKTFSQGGQWEKNNGRNQTRRFAECFTQNTNIPFKEFSLLDVGCALGDAAPVFRKAYPEARLYGCDVSQVAIERCKKDHGNSAEFFKAGFEDISGLWDVIYCSNVLEHFEEYKKIASWLLNKCNILYIMAPFFELKKGKPLDPKGDTVHKVTLYKDSFDELFKQGLLSSPIRTTIIRCPGAWSPPLLKEISREIRRGLKMIFLRQYCPPRLRQIIYELINKNYRSNE
jgi:hypothetical protein